MIKKKWNRRKLRKRDLIIIIVPTVAALCVAIGIFLLNREIMEFKIDQNAKQYYAGMSYEVPKGSKLQRNGEGKTTLSKGGSSNEVDSLPIYFDDTNSLVFPDDMIYYNPRQKTENYLPYFSKISREKEAISVIRNNTTVGMDLGFVYDGKDFYLFLEPVTITLNGKQHKLSAFSYASAVYEDVVMLFDYDTKSFLASEQATEEVIVTMKSGDYELSLLNDTLTFHDGTKALLVTQPSLLESKFEEK